MKCKIRITKDNTDLFPEYKPTLGKIYDAEYIDQSRSYHRYPPICVVNIAGKRIVIRKDEFEIVQV